MSLPSGHALFGKDSWPWGSVSCVEASGQLTIKGEKLQNIKKPSVAKCFAKMLNVIQGCPLGISVVTWRYHPHLRNTSGLAARRHTPDIRCGTSLLRFANTHCFPNGAAMCGVPSETKGTPMCFIRCLWVPHLSVSFPSKTCSKNFAFMQ